MSWTMLRRSYEYRVYAATYMTFFLAAIVVYHFAGPTWALIPAFMAGYALARMHVWGEVDALNQKERP